jgi:hypothetical protein
MQPQYAFAQMVPQLGFVEMLHQSSAIVMKAVSSAAYSVHCIRVNARMGFCFFL